MGMGFWEKLKSLPATKGDLTLVIHLLTKGGASNKTLRRVRKIAGR